MINNIFLKDYPGITKLSVQVIFHTVMNNGHKTSEETAYLDWMSC